MPWHMVHLNNNDMICIRAVVSTQYSQTRNSTLWQAPPMKHNIYIIILDAHVHIILTARHVFAHKMITMCLCTW